MVRAVASSSPSRILDLACGSGDVSLLLQQSLPNSEVIALDFCLPLLQQAKARGVRQTLEGDAQCLPFPPHHFSAVTLAFGLRNFSDRPKALAEIHRVLQPGALFALLEFSPPPFPLKLFWDFYLFHLMPLFAQLFTRQGDSFRYLAQSIARFPNPQKLEEELIAAQLFPFSSRSFSAGLVRLTLCHAPN